MYKYPPPFSLWSVWPYLTAWEKLFLMALGCLSAYAVFSLAITFRCIRKIGAAAQEGNSAGVEGIFVTMRRRYTRLQELIKTAVYLFGIVLFFSFQWAYVILETSSRTVESLVLRNFMPRFVFAFHVFSVLLILHLLSWILSNCIDAFGVPLKRQRLP